MGMGQCVCLRGHVFGGDFPDKPPADHAGGVLSGKNFGTFQIPVDRSQETSSGDRMMIL